MHSVAARGPDFRGILCLPRSWPPLLSTPLPARSVCPGCPAQLGGHVLPPAHHRLRHPGLHPGAAGGCRASWHGVCCWPLCRRAALQSRWLSLQRRRAACCACASRSALAEAPPLPRPPWLPQTTLIATDFKPARVVSEIESTLKMQLVVSTLIMTPVSRLWMEAACVVCLSGHQGALACAPPRQRAHSAPRALHRQHVLKPCPACRPPAVL